MTSDGRVLVREIGGNVPVGVGWEVEGAEGLDINSRIRGLQNYRRLNGPEAVMVSERFSNNEGVMLHPMVLFGNRWWMEVVGNKRVGNRGASVSLSFTPVVQEGLELLA